MDSSQIMQLLYLESMNLFYYNAKDVFYQIQKLAAWTQKQKARLTILLGD